MDYDAAYFEQLKAYSALRRLAYEHAEARLSAAVRVDVSLYELDHRSLNAWLDLGSEFMMDWNMIAPSYLRNPDAFHLGIWQGAQLCAVAVGKPNRTHSALAIHFLEGLGGPANPLKGIQLISAYEAATAYGKVLGCKMLRIRNPVPQMVARLEKAGFVLARKSGSARYWEREIDR